VTRLATDPDVAARAADVRDRLIAAGVDVEPIGSETSPTGDPNSLARIRDRSVDLALVSVSSLRGAATDGLTLLAVLPREEPRDVLIGVDHAPTSLRGLPTGARVGVPSTRQRAFLLAHRPDVVPVDLERGAAEDLASGVVRVDAAVLSSTEARRAGLGGRVGEVLDARSWLPEPGRGMVALLARHPIAEVTALDHLPTRTALRAELALLDALVAPEGTALGSLAQPSGRLVRLWAAMASLDGTRFVRSDLTAPLDEPELLGAAVARQLRTRAAGVVMQDAV
jgi:hydroxymethylbilane synthase